MNENQDKYTYNDEKEINTDRYSESEMSTGNYKETIKKIIIYYRDYKVKIILAVIFSVFGSLLSVLCPQIVSRIINLIQEGLKDKIDIYSVIDLVCILIGLYLISSIMSFVQNVSMAVVAQKVTKHLHKDLSEKVNRIPVKYFHNIQVGDFLSRVINDVDLIGVELSTSAVRLISSLTLLIGMILIMLTTNILMTLTVVVSSLIGFILIINIMKYSQKYFEQQQNYLGDINNYIEEIYGNNFIVKAFNKENDTKKQFDVFNDRLRNSSYMADCFSGLINPLMSFIGSLGYVLVCIVGSLLAFNGKISFGVIIAFIMYASSFLQIISQFGQIVQVVQLSAAAGRRVFDILDAEEMDSEEYKSEIIDSNEGKVDFLNVEFGYEGTGKSVINDFTAKILPGQKVAIVGPTGAGKSTLVNLLMRFYDIQRGDIRIEGHSITALKRRTIREQFCMILQDTWIFEGTIYENLVFTSDNVSKEHIDSVCEAVGLDRFIHTLPLGYDTIIGDNTCLSSGQKQQIAIARAIISDRPMLIMDEATSCVDTRLEQIIQNAMDKLMQGRTSFVIAHRLSTIKNADLILVLKDGDIIESGTHNDLINQNGFYNQLYYSQFHSI